MIPMSVSLILIIKESLKVRLSYLKCNHNTFLVAYFCKPRIHATCNEVENKADKTKREEASDIQPITTETSSP